MGMHTVAFSSSIANGSTYLALSAISDTIMAPSGSGLLLPCDLRMIAGFASGVTLQRARVNAPSLLRVGYPSIRPLRSSAATPDSDPNFMSLLGNPVLLRSSEALGVDAVHGLGTPEREFALLWLADRLEPVPAGDSFSLRFTASVTTTANAWTVLSPTYDQSIPSGTYAVIGMEAIGTNALAARLVFPGAVFRPGVVASTSTASRTHASFYDGSFGTYGIFQTNSPPNIEWLSALTADTSEEGYLRVVRIGDVGASPMLPGGPMLPPSASPVMGAGGGVAGVSGGGVSAGGALSTSAGLYGTKR